MDEFNSDSSFSTLDFENELDSLYESEFGSELYLSSSDSELDFMPECSTFNTLRTGLTRPTMEFFTEHSPETAVLLDQLYTLSSPAEFNYYVDKLTTYLNRIVEKGMVEKHKRNLDTTASPDSSILGCRNGTVHSKSNLSDIEEDMEEREHAIANKSVKDNNTHYIIRDWTLKKLNKKIFVVGTLFHKTTEQLIKNNCHIDVHSRPDKSVIRFNGDYYHLGGKFISNPGIPSDIRKQCGDGNFPRLWKSLFKSWSESSPGMENEELEMTTMSGRASRCPKRYINKEWETPDGKFKGRKSY